MTTIWTVANALSGVRIAAAPALLVAAWFGQAGLFLAGLCAAFATDVADGFVARRLGQTSELGARLDSLGDLLLYAVLPLGVWWLWPDAIRAEAAVVGVALAAFTLPIGAGLLRWRRLTSYHTWGAKLSAWLVGGGTLALIALDQPWLLRLAASVLVVSALEELAITAVLPRWTADVPTLRHALRIRQAKAKPERAASRRRAKSLGPSSPGTESVEGTRQAKAKPERAASRRRAKSTKPERAASRRRVESIS